MDRYIQERYFEIDRGEHGGLTQRGMNQVLDEMGIRQREERRWYRRVWTQMGNAEGEVQARKFREMQKDAPQRVSRR